MGHVNTMDKRVSIRLDPLSANVLRASVKSIHLEKICAKGANLKVKIR